MSFTGLQTFTGLYIYIREKSMAIEYIYLYMKEKDKKNELHWFANVHASLIVFFIYIYIKQIFIYILEKNPWQLNTYIFIYIFVNVELLQPN